MIYELFAFTGLMVWLIVGAVSLLVLLTTANESPGWAAFVLVASAVLVFGFTDYTLSVSPGDLALFAAAYIGAGAVYTGARWLLLVRQISNRFQQLLFSDTMQEEQIVRTLREEYASDSPYPLTLPPKARQFRGRVYTWLWLWPVSILLWLFEDAIQQVASALVRVVSNGLNSLTSLAWDDTGSPPRRKAD